MIKRSHCTMSLTPSERASSPGTCATQRTGASSSSARGVQWGAQRSVRTSMRRRPLAPDSVAVERKGASGPVTSLSATFTEEWDVIK